MVSILIGNKSDLVDKREVSAETASKFAQENGMKYLEVSSKDYVNVNEAFHNPCQEVLSKIESGEINPSEEFGIKVGHKQAKTIKKAAPQGTNNQCCN